MPRAYADIVVPRSSLKIPSERQKIRETLYRTLLKMGHVQQVERYAVDPPDGPYNDSSYDHLDRDANAIVRCVAQVQPFSERRN